MGTVIRSLTNGGCVRGWRRLTNDRARSCRKLVDNPTTLSQIGVRLIHDTIQYAEALLHQLRRAVFPKLWPILVRNGLLRQLEKRHGRKFPCQSSMFVHQQRHSANCVIYLVFQAFDFMPVGTALRCCCFDTLDSFKFGSARQLCPKVRACFGEHPWNQDCEQQYRTQDTSSWCASPRWRIQRDSDGEECDQEGCNDSNNCETSWQMGVDRRHVGGCNLCSSTSRVSLDTVVRRYESRSLRAGRIAFASALSNFRISAFRSSARSRSSSARTSALTRFSARENEASLFFLGMRVL